jgi:MFS family permease
MLAGQIAHWGGRRLCFYAVAFLSLIGVIVEATADVNGGRYYQMVGGKIIVGGEPRLGAITGHLVCTYTMLRTASIGIASIAVPLYLAECAPAAIRGACVNAYVTIQALGSWMAYCCLYTLVDGTGRRVWLIPICIQLLAPIFMIAFVSGSCRPERSVPPSESYWSLIQAQGWWLPESPRWLVEKGRTEEARAALFRIRGARRGGYSPDEDLTALVQAHEDQQAAHNNVAWLDCFKGSDLLRTSIVMGVQCLQQGQGLSFLSQYLIVFFQRIGIQQPYLIMTISESIVTALRIHRPKRGWLLTLVSRWSPHRPHLGRILHPGLHRPSTPAHRRLLHHGSQYDRPRRFDPQVGDPPSSKQRGSRNE